MSSDEESREQFVRLLTQNERRIYGFILSLVPNWNDADEILQETNVKLWKEFDQYVAGSNFVAWAIRVAHFEVLTWRKKAARSRLVFDQRFVDLVAAEQGREAERETGSSEARYQALGSCIEQMPHRSRDLLSRCYSHGATIAKVAETLQRSKDSVYKALQRARMALHKCIELRLTQDDAK